VDFFSRNENGVSLSPTFYAIFSVAHTLLNRLSKMPVLDIDLMNGFHAFPLVSVQFSTRWVHYKIDAPNRASSDRERKPPNGLSNGQKINEVYDT